MAGGWVKLPRALPRSWYNLSYPARCMAYDWRREFQHELVGLPRSALWAALAIPARSRRKAAQYLAELVTQGVILESTDGLWMPSSAPRAHLERPPSAPPTHLERTSNDPPVHLQRTSSAPRTTPQCTSSAPRAHLERTSSAPPTHPQPDATQRNRSGLPLKKRERKKERKKDQEKDKTLPGLWEVFDPVRRDEYLAPFKHAWGRGFPSLGPRVLHDLAERLQRETGQLSEPDRLAAFGRIVEHAKGRFAGSDKAKVLLRGDWGPALEARPDAQPNYHQPWTPEADPKYRQALAQREHGTPEQPPELDELLGDIGK